MKQHGPYPQEGNNNNTRIDPVQIQSVSSCGDPAARAVDTTFKSNH